MNNVQLKVYDVGPEFWEEWSDPIINSWTSNTFLWSEKLDSYDQYYLELYEWDPIKLTFSLEDQFDLTPQSTFSRRFRVPATPYNNQFFQYAFEINGVDFDATIKKPAEVLVDGAFFRYGHIRLTAVITDRESGNIDYEILFLGEVADISTVISDRTLCELNFDDYQHANTFANIQQSWQAFPEGGREDGLFGGDILYPLIEFGNTYDSSGTVLETRIASEGARNFTQNSNPLEVNRFKPMIRAKAVWDRIFQTYGFSYRSEFLESDRFKKMYISLFGNDPQVEIFSGSSINIFSATTLDISQVLTPTKQLLRFENEVLDAANNYDTTTSRFTAPVSGTYTFRAQGVLYMRSKTSVPLTGTIGLYKTPIGPNPPTIVGNSFTTVNGNQTISVEGSITLSAGEQVAVLLEISGTDYSLNWEAGTWSQGAFECIEAPGNIVPNLLFDCEYKQIDFIKDIVTLFRLVVAPDNRNPRRFLIEPWVDFVGKGSRYDWSSKLDGTRDVTIEPLFYSQTRDIEFNFSEEEDYINRFHQQTTKHEFGYLNFLSGNQMLNGTKEIRVNFAPTPMLQLEGEGPNSNFIIPQVHTHSNTDAGLEHLPIKPETRILFYNGLQSPNASVTFNHWHVDDGATVHVLTDWPLVSPYEDWYPNEDSLVLNWTIDTPYFGTTVVGLNGRNGISVFDRYWSSYISDVYNRFGRKLTAYFILDSYDLKEITFDDAILIDGTWYRVDKMYDFDPSSLNSVRCELIKMIGFREATDELVVEVSQNSVLDTVNAPAATTFMSFNSYAVGDPLNDVNGPNGSFTKAGYDVVTSGGNAIAWRFPENGLYKMKYRWLVRYDSNLWDPFSDGAILKLRLSAFIPTSTDINLVGAGQLVSLFPDEQPDTSFVLLDYETPILDLRDAATFPINDTQVRLAEFQNGDPTKVGQTMFTYNLSSVQVFKTS